MSDNKDPKPTKDSANTEPTPEPVIRTRGKFYKDKPYVVSGTHGGTLYCPEMGTYEGMGRSMFDSNLCEDV